MAKTLSTMLELGTRAPDFALPDTQGRTMGLAEVSGKKGLVVLFICNHCPYVKHINRGLVQFAEDYLNKDMGVVAVSSNDSEKYPDDAPKKMAEASALLGYPFPYLFDATQAVAKSYRAACTPDIYLFDAELKLVYRGQFDDSRPNTPIPVTGQDLRAAVDAMLAGAPITADQKPSIGCNIKWKPGNEPDYFG